MWFNITIALILMGIVLLKIFRPKEFKMIQIISYHHTKGIYRFWFPPPRKSVKDDVILITGGAMGMGAIMGERLGKLGAKIVLCDIQEDQLTETVQKLKEAGIQVWGFPCDVSDRENIYELAERVKSEVGTVTILFNNAGIMSGKPILEISDKCIEKTIQINTLAHFWTIKAFLPGMLEQNRGHIVTISSSAGLFGVNKLSAYCASKFAVTGLHESLMCELFSMGRLADQTDKNGIHLTSVHPYFVHTELAKGVISSNTLKTYSPEEAVDCIVDGVLRNKRVLIMPNTLMIFMVQKVMMAGDTSLYLGEAIKVHNAFDKFEGRGWK